MRDCLKCLHHTLHHCLLDTQLIYDVLLTCVGLGCQETKYRCLNEVAIDEEGFLIEFGLKGEFVFEGQGDEFLFGLNFSEVSLNSFPDRIKEWRKCDVEGNLIDKHFFPESQTEDIDLK
jgi:hypothetical protein